MSNRGGINKCKRCRGLYHVGYNGLGNGLCDKCAGVSRDQNGYAWTSGERAQIYQDTETGLIETVTREEAFSYQGRE